MAKGKTVETTATLAGSSPRAEQSPALELHDVAVRFGGVSALSGVSITVPRHTPVGIIGPNGAGKTTLLNVASGFVRAQSGSVMLDGTDVSAMPARKRAVAGIGRTFQTPRLFPELTVGENLLVVGRRRRRGQAVATAIALELAGVPGIEDMPVERLLAGQRRFVELARCLMLNPSVLLLDEPATGLRDEEVTTLTACLQNLVATTRVAILVISHDMRVITDACASVVVLENGGVLAKGTPEEIQKNPSVISAYFGAGDAE